MAIMVDELRRWPGKGVPGVFGGEHLSCHLTTDGALEELHLFAERIGMRRAWFQPRSTPHYDLTPRGRELALREGAVFVPARTQAKVRMALKKTLALSS